MKKIAISVILMAIAGGVYASGFEQQLSVGASDMKVTASENKDVVVPSRGVQFQEPYPGWWGTNPDVIRIKAEFDQLNTAIDQVNGANMFTTWGARASACEALMKISREGASPNQDTVNNLNCVINWMFNDADGRRWEIDKVRGFVNTWSMVGHDPMIQIFTGWLPDQIARTKCVGDHSAYLRDRINGVAASSGF
jgi:hypothetical protein